MPYSFEQCGLDHFKHKERSEALRLWFMFKPHATPEEKAEFSKILDKPETCLGPEYHRYDIQRTSARPGATRDKQ